MRALWALGLVAAVTSGCKASFSAAAPLAYPCSRDGGASVDSGADPQCPGGWVCGLEGRCHDPKVGAPYPCARELDCAGGWVCGLDGTCHDPLVGAPYPCALDTDCAAAWRCSVDGRCVGNVADEALRAGPGPLDAGRAFHWPLQRLPDQFAVGEMLALGPNDLVQPFGYLQGSQLTVGYQVVSVVDSSFGTAQPMRVLDAGSDVKDFGLSGDTLVLQRQGGVESVRLLFDGGLLAGPPTPAPVLGDRIRITRGIAPLAVSFTEAAVWLLGPSVPPFAQGARPVVGLDGGPRVIRDVADVSTRACASKVTIASDELVIYLPRDRNGFFLDSDAGFPAAVTLELGTLKGLVGVDFKANTLRTPGDGVLAMASKAPADGGQALVVLVDLADAPDAGCDKVDVTLRLGPYPLCSPGDTVVDFHPLSGGAKPELVARCRNGDRERTMMLSVPAGGEARLVDARPVADDSSLFSDAVQGSRSTPGAPGYVGGHGQLWVGSAAWPPVPVVPDRPPQFAVLTFTPASPGRAASSAPLFGNPTGGWLLGSESSLPVWVQYRPGDPRAVATIAGKPSWAVMEGGLVLDLENHALVGSPMSSSPGGFAGPYLAAFTQTSDGGQQLVVSSGDALYGADVDRKVGELEWKLVPLSGANLRSMVFLPGRVQGDGGVPLFEGYVLAQTHLFALTAVSTQRWQTQELSLPADGEPEKVWADGPRARLAFEDGRVMSLPGRVMIAPMLPEKDATDFAQVCGQGYALSSGGLYRLDRAADGGPVGDWASVPVTSFLPGGADGGDFGFTGGRLLTLNNDLYVFSRFGAAAKLSGPATCP